MHLGIPALLDFYRAHKEDDALVLVTIIGTEGSTYRKTGAMMLISADHTFEGMISGGCLEGDLIHHADEVFVSGQPKFVTYDMHAGDDLVWNLGLGCDGIIHLLLQRLERDGGFGFLQQLHASMTARHAVLLALSIVDTADLPAGTFAVLAEGGSTAGKSALQKVLQRETAEHWPEWRFVKKHLVDDDGDDEVMLIHIPPRTRVLICGAGPDAVPVAETLCGLDWEVLIVDHRPAFTRPGRFPDRCQVIQARPEQLSSKIDLKEIDAAVVMSHHLENDSVYLGQLAEQEMAYIGCLGPAARSVRLKELAGCPGLKVHGPVGLDIGAELPEAIALSLVAEIHAVLNKRGGLPLISTVEF